MAMHIEHTLLLPDLAAQYVQASHSVSLRLLAYALQAFPSPEPFQPTDTRTTGENINIMRLWADMLVARGENAAAANVQKDVALWCHNLAQETAAAAALVQSHCLLLENIPTTEALENTRGLARLLEKTPDAPEKYEAQLLLAECFLDCGDIEASKQLRIAAVTACSSLRLESALLTAKTYLAEDLTEQAIYLLDDLKANINIFPDIEGARVALGFFRLKMEIDQGNLAAALTEVEDLIALTKASGLLLQEALACATRTEIDAQLMRDDEVIKHGIHALELTDQLNLGETRRVGVKAVLARALARLGRPAKGIDYCEEIATWAHEHKDLELEQEFTVLAADLAARDLQGIRAAGFYGCAADLYNNQPLLRARYLRKCAVQLVSSAGEDRQKTIAWAMSLLREAGELLQGLERDGEVAGELSAWEFDRLWIRTRR